MKLRAGTKVALIGATVLATIPWGGVTAKAVNSSAADELKKCFDYQREELGFFRKLTAARRRAGQPDIRLDRHLSRIARKHSSKMMSQRLLHHTPAARLRRHLTDWEVIGENVGVGGTVASLHDAFMQSRPHRANILESGFQHVGIGTRQARGRLWVTVVFEEGSNPGTTLWMPGC